jgi:hypothetical protein
MGFHFFGKKDLRYTVEMNEGLIRFSHPVSFAHGAWYFCRS